jgi:PAT family beta-lactamase induction signal transducer AmpG
MVLYKLGDNMATALATPFYLDLGFSTTEIGFIAKNAGLWPSIAGGILGGVAMLKIGINRALWVFGFAQLVPILGFAVLADAGHSKLLLAVVVGLEAFGVGLGTAAFVAFIARETVPSLAATQIALFTALAAMPRVFATATTGFLIEGGDPEALDGASRWLMVTLGALGLPQGGLGYTRFFYLCAIVAIPGMLLLLWVAPWRVRDAHL